MVCLDALELEEREGTERLESLEKKRGSREEGEFFSFLRVAAELHRSRQ